MDAVILAAGRGSRLEGVAPPYHKPLLIVNGRPLIAQAVDLALGASCQSVTIVVAPENALPITQVLGDRECTVIVQRRPTGPGDALLEGLKVGRAFETLILMADNITSRDDVERVTGTSGNVIGVRHMPPQQAVRFTRHTGGSWVEKTPLFEHELGRRSVMTWVGPLKLQTREIRDAVRQLPRHEVTGERPLGPALNGISTQGCTFVTVSTIDVGLPEEL